ncbi:hypothetical protein ACWD3Z_33445 [Streptomyces sp. NPDC002740]
MATQVTAASVLGGALARDQAALARDARRGAELAARIAGNPSTSLSGDIGRLSQEGASLLQLAVKIETRAEAVGLIAAEADIDRSNLSVSKPVTADEAGLVVKTSAYPSRIKGPRSPHVHAANWTGGLTLTTACGQRKNEESVDHLDEFTPITCPRCQRAVKE